MEKDDKEIIIPPPGEQTFFQKYGKWGVVLPYAISSIAARLGYLAYKKYKAGKKDDKVKK